MFRKPVFWALGYTHFVRMGLIFALISWVPFFLMEDLNFSIVSAALALSSISAAGIISGPVGGLLAKSKGEVPVSTLSLLAFSCTLYLFGVSSSPPIAWVLIIMNGVLGYLHLGPIWSLSTRKSPSGQVGIISGYYNTFAAVGAVIMPFLIGYLRDLTGSFIPGWTVIAILCGLGALTIQLSRFDRTNVGN